ncbi:MAG: cytochrome c [Deltaproteobacteria bacterium]|nr:cytochrome c [Deltaproteobacteria bacterium]
MDWRKYQNKYKNELIGMAQTEQQRKFADDYEIKLRQIVLPKLDRADRCISCHVGIEDSRMNNHANPIKAHPGNYLETHDINLVGCTSCHDGQGRAIIAVAAHGRGEDQYWETPLLKSPFIQSNCVRCHSNGPSQAQAYNHGKTLFQQKGCVGCHKISEAGGVIGPALSDIGRASFHAKMPIAANRERLLNQFDGNVNLAYLFEAVSEPKAQPKDSTMPTMEFSEEELTAILVYLKSLSTQRSMMEIGDRPQALAANLNSPPTTDSKIRTNPTSALSSRGQQIFTKACVACHTIGSGDRVGPDLKGVTSRRDKTWLKSFIQAPNKKIENKDPITMELLAKYKTPMPGLGLTPEDIDEVIRYLKNPQSAQLIPSETSPASPDNKSSAANRIDIKKGLALFQGSQRLLNEGPACITCHDVRNKAVFAGGRLAKELTQSFFRLREAGMTAILKDPPFPLMRAAYQNNVITADEATALTAFLEQVTKEQGDHTQSDSAPKILFSGLVGLALLFGLYYAAGLGRKRETVNKSIYDRQIKSTNRKGIL